MVRKTTMSWSMKKKLYMAWAYETREKERLLVFKIQWRYVNIFQDSFTFMFFPHFSMTIPGQATHTSTPS